MFSSIDLETTQNLLLHTLDVQYGLYDIEIRLAGLYY